MASSARLQRHTSCIVTYDISESSCVQRCSRRHPHLHAASDPAVVTITVLRMVRASVMHHPVALILILASLMWCHTAGQDRTRYVDNSFFKVLGVLLALLLSLRAKAGVSTRQRLIERIVLMINSARTLLDLVAQVQPENFETMHKVIYYSYMRIARWFSDHADSDDDIFGPQIQDIPREFQRDLLRAGGMLELGVPPRSVIVYLSKVTDILLDKQASRYARIADGEIKNILGAFDSMSICDEDIQPDRLRQLLDVLIFLYVVLYPWCVDTEGFHVLAGTTLGISFTFYGLSILTHEIIHPSRRHSQGIDLQATFDLAFKTIERQREMEQEFMQQAHSMSKDGDIQEDLRKTVSDNFRVAYDVVEDSYSD
eukprot:TRINITY_DN102219_c0_g1_i1.p1 TRINITY_DN102219_c0_g1~~TRINITY_DN102219_c0_g1_i1.p1  ORF type:complete len:370 (+),score=53.42 TRINITY_DN102219_c0_g1_i1:20-1129(+)